MIFKMSAKLKNILNGDETITDLNLKELARRVFYSKQDSKLTALNYGSSERPTSNWIEVNINILNKKSAAFDCLSAIDFYIENLPAGAWDYWYNDEMVEFAFSI